jgi:hypothetical protein
MRPFLFRFQTIQLSSVGLRRLRGDAPDGIPDIIGDKKRVRLVECDTNGSAKGIAIGAQETCQHVAHFTVRLAVLEWNEYDFVARRRIAVPGAMLSNESAVAQLSRPSPLPIVEGKA